MNATEARTLSKLVNALDPTIRAWTFPPSTVGRRNNDWRVIVEKDEAPRFEYSTYQGEHTAPIPREERVQEDVLNRLR